MTERREKDSMKKIWIADEVKKIKEKYNYDFSDYKIFSSDNIFVANDIIENLSSCVNNPIFKKMKKSRKNLDLVTYCGFLICSIDFNELDELEDAVDDCYGILRISRDFLEKWGTDKVIIYNKDLPREKARWVVSCLFFSYILDFNETKENEFNCYYWSRYDNDTEFLIIKDEIYPVDRYSRLAREVIMPKDDFITKYKVFKQKNRTYYELINGLADCFEAPAFQIKERLIDLGLLKIPKTPKIQKNHYSHNRF